MALVFYRQPLDAFVRVTTALGYCTGQVPSQYWPSGNVFQNATSQWAVIRLRANQAEVRRAGEPWPSLYVTALIPEAKWARQALTFTRDWRHPTTGKAITNVAQVIEALAIVKGPVDQAEAAFLAGPPHR